LFDAEIGGVGMVVARIAGIALIGLGIACWPSGETGRGTRRAYVGLLSYNGLAALCLAQVGLAGELTGGLL
jgi:hypothetical protein